MPSTLFNIKYRKNPIETCDLESKLLETKRKITPKTKTSRRTPLGSISSSTNRKNGTQESKSM